MKRRGSWLFIGLVAIVLHTAAIGDDKKAAKIDGTWEQQGYENYGKFNEVPKNERSTHTFDQGKLLIKSQAPKFERDGKYVVGDTKSPKHLDLTYKIGKDVQTIPCLYEIDGDTLRIVKPFDGPKGPRPTEMKSDVHGQIEVYKRVKK